MSFPEVRRVVFSVNGFLDGEPSPPDILLDENLLGNKDHLIVLTHREPPFLATLGVPHHAAPGAERICEHRLDVHGKPHPREADENAAIYALAAFGALAHRRAPCKLVIMVHPTTHDPNKILDSPYCQEVFAEPARLLFECHGSRRDRRLDLELSAGRNPLPDTLAFGQELAIALGYRYSLGVQREPEKRTALIFEPGGQVREGNLELPARQTLSLVEAGRRRIPALHLEARPRFRRQAPESQAAAEDGLALGRGIGHTIAWYLRFN